MPDLMTKERLVRLTTDVDEWLERFVTAGLTEQQLERRRVERQRITDATGRDPTPVEDGEILRRIRGT